MASLMRWDPFRDLFSLQRDVDRLFSDVGWYRPLLGDGGERTRLAPTMDVFMRGEDMILRAEMPGIDLGNVDIAVTDGVLTVHAERRTEEEIKEDAYLVRESTWDTMERSVRLPESAEIDKIHADYTDGILEITVPKAATMLESRTHKIAVEAHPGSKELTEHH